MSFSLEIEISCLILLSYSCQVSFGDSGIPSKHKLFRLDRFSRSSSLFPRFSICTLTSFTLRSEVISFSTAGYVVF